MVSEKVVVILIIIAIVLSLVSVTVTVSSINLNIIRVPEINIIQGNTEDSQQGRVSIIILPPEP